MEEGRRAVEAVARESYGRLISFLSARCRDVASAEDALSEAFLAALRTWPREGVPASPEAWLMRAARHRLIDRFRHDRVRAEAAVALDLAARNAEAVVERKEFPDDRLRLLFVCAHPAIDPDVHSPLMLQTVLGLDASRIARAFLVAPAAMSQRLVRAKAKIRDAGIEFAVPGAAELPDRLEAVLGAIYAAYGSGWEEVAGADARPSGLTREAIWLARLLVRLLPGEPEAQGLLALMLHCEARREARRDAGGAYVPLTAQDVRLWSRAMIEEAESLLTLAARAARPGRFQLEAAIQSAHVERALTGGFDWEAIVVLYEALTRLTPTVGAFVGHAAALAEARGAEAGLRRLAALPWNGPPTYQPYWALRAHLLDRQGRVNEAREAYERAIALSEDRAVRAFLLARSHA